MCETNMPTMEEKAANYAKNWRLKAPPLRPEQAVLGCFRGILKQYEKPRVLVLGATPELIDMAILEGASRIVSVEIRPDVSAALKSMCLLAHDKDNDNDRNAKVEYVVGDWLDCRDDFKGSFDVVLCDGGTMFLPFPHSWQTLFSNATQYLSRTGRGGTFCTRTLDFRGDGRTFEQAMRDKIDEFDQLHKVDKVTDPNQDVELAYREMTSTIFGQCFVDTVDDKGIIDKSMLPSRFKHAFETLQRRYPQAIFQPHLQAFVDPKPAFLPCSGPPFDLVQPLIEKVVPGIHYTRTDLPPVYAWDRYMITMTHAQG